MDQTTGISNERNITFLAGSIVALLAFFWFFVPARYVLFANSDVTLFLTTPDYLRSFLKRPGGLLEYTGSFFAQFLRFRLFGAFLLASFAALSFCLTVQLLKRQLKNVELLTAGLVTAALVVAMHNYYPHRIHHTLGLLLSIFLACMAPSRGRGMRIYLALSVPIFYLACGGFVWFFLFTWLIRMLSLIHI